MLSLGTSKGWTLFGSILAGNGYIRYISLIAERSESVADKDCSKKLKLNLRSNMLLANVTIVKGLAVVSKQCGIHSFKSCNAPAYERPRHVCLRMLQVRVDANPVIQQRWLGILDLRLTMSYLLAPGAKSADSKPCSSEPTKSYLLSVRVGASRLACLWLSTCGQ